MAVISMSTLLDKPIFHEFKIDSMLGLGMSALVGDPDPYPWVFGCQILHPDL